MFPPNSYLYLITSTILSTIFLSTFNYTINHQESYQHSLAYLKICLTFLANFSLLQFTTVQPTYIANKRKNRPMSSRNISIMFSPLAYLFCGIWFQHHLILRLENFSHEQWLRQKWVMVVGFMSCWNGLFRMLVLWGATSAQKVVQLIFVRKTIPCLSQMKIYWAIEYGPLTLWASTKILAWVYIMTEREAHKSEPCSRREAHKREQFHAFLNENYYLFLI